MAVNLFCPCSGCTGPGPVIASEAVLPIQVVPDLAPMLWHTGAVIAALLHEIVSIYSYMNPPTLTAVQSNRVCNALALLQCVASHPETRSAFLAVSESSADTGTLFGNWPGDVGCFW